MAEKEQLIKEKIEHLGLMDFTGLYKFSHIWLVEENYDVTEEEYKESVSGNARNIGIKWAAVKKISDYFKHEVKLEFKVSELVDVEVEIDGKKKKMNKGKVIVEIKGMLVKDPDSKWDSTAFYRFLRDVYNKYVIPSRISGSENKIVSDVIKIKEEIKSYLELTAKR